MQLCVVWLMKSLKMLEWLISNSKKRKLVHFYNYCIVNSYMQEKLHLHDLLRNQKKCRIYGPKNVQCTLGDRCFI